MKRVYDWEAIQRYHDEGNGFVECRLRLGFSHTAWIKAIKRGELRPSASPYPDRRRRYDWAEIQAYYDQSRSYRECRVKFGFQAMSWHKARLRGEIRPRPQGMPLDELQTPTYGGRNMGRLRRLQGSAKVV